MSLDTASTIPPSVEGGFAGPAPDTAFDSITDFVLEVTGSAMGYLSIAKPISGKRAYTSLRQLTATPSSHASAVLEAISSEVFRSGQPVSISDLRAEINTQEQYLVDESGIASCLAVPVTGCANSPAAVLSAIDVKPRDWSDDDVKKLTRVGGFVSTQIRLRAALELRDTQHQILLQEVEARRTVERELQRQACTDALTGLANRRAFERACAAYLDNVASSEIVGAVVMIDLDQFKTINDSHGHGAGDLVLSEAASRIKSGLGARPDLVARLGGEEFAAVLPGLGLGEAELRAERCRLQLADVPIHLCSGHPIQITASFGVAPISADDPTMATALARADRALYSAKAKGRNQVALL
ncbi:MAG: diguanylate cyclase [Pseudomonadota bacterium]